MIRNVKKGPKWSTFSLEFPGKTGKPWNDLHGQVYDLMRESTPVVDYNVFKRYFDALRQAKRVFHSFGEKKAQGKAGGDKTDEPATSKEVFEKHVEELGEARIRGDVSKFRELRDSMILTIDAAIKKHINFNRTATYQMAELRERWCRELIYLKIELESALLDEALDVSVLGYNIADAGLHEWQTAGRKEARDAKKKRKAGRTVLEESLQEAKKARLAEAEASSVIEPHDSDPSP